jgi:hypothetical protein
MSVFGAVGLGVDKKEEAEEAEGADRRRGHDA